MNDLSRKHNFKEEISLKLEEARKKDDINLFISEKRLDNSFFLPFYDFSPFDSLLRPPITDLS